MSHSTVPRSRAEAGTPGRPPATADGATESAGKPPSPPSQKLSLRLRFRRDRVLLLMTLPAVALVVVFNYLPILGNVVAFQDYDPYISDNGLVAMLNSPFVGLDNFQRIFEDSAFWNAVENTLVLFFVQLVLFFPIPILLALLINSVVRPRVRAVAQAVLYLPHFFSWVLVVAVFQQMFGGAGMLSQLLRQNGYDGLDIMTNPDTFAFLITAQSVWKDAGWGIIVFLAALASVPTDHYEADAFQQDLLQRDGVGPGAGEVLDTFVWWNGVRNQDFGYAAAAGLVKGVVSIGLVLAANKVAHLMGEQGVYKK